ncbi:LysR substrate-binding domain-containing protein [Cochlodiniinecator piscidefendens]|uniref:LysR substrate-binding domain-containing protein n=1 Tax=Cochlodiniinecator piscidefendens TaxID=2715756 RepID=UPI00140D2568|nr:LysR substrate-binding domain-containing protein [Cochlodiniinecator piscidefendens]
MKHLPNLGFLRSFEASARHLSFTAAADELNLTQSAVSHHIRALEDYLGRPLFVRYPRSLSLTGVGEAYLPTVRQALQQVDAATESIMAEQHEKKVVISSPISLAEIWLVGQIRTFREVHPDIDITLHGTVWTDVEDNVADLRITLEETATPPAHAIPLWDERVTLACSPSYHKTHLKTPDDLGQATLVHVLGRPVYWQLVEEALGCSNLQMQGGLKTSNSNVALEFAAQNMGCVALLKSVVTPYVTQGRLVEPFDLEIASPWGYYLSDGGDTLSPSARLFKAWLIEK